MLTRLLHFCLGRFEGILSSPKINKLAHIAAETLTYPSVVKIYFGKQISISQVPSPASPLASLRLDDEEISVQDLTDSVQYVNICSLFLHLENIEDATIAHCFELIVNGILATIPETILSFFYGEKKWMKLLISKLEFGPISKLLKKIVNLSLEGRPELCFKFLKHRLRCYFELVSILDNSNFSLSQRLAIADLFIDLLVNADKIMDGIFFVEQVLFSSTRAAQWLRNGISLKQGRFIDIFTLTLGRLFEGKKNQIKSRTETQNIPILTPNKPIYEEETAEFLGDPILTEGRQVQLPLPSLRNVSQNDDLKLDMPRTPDEEEKIKENQSTAETSNDLILNFELEVYDLASHRAQEFMDELSQETALLQKTLLIPNILKAIADSSSGQTVPASAFMISLIKALSSIAKSSNCYLQNLIQSSLPAQSLNFYLSHPFNNILHSALFDLLETFLSAITLSCDRPRGEAQLIEFTEALNILIQKVLEDQKSMCPKLLFAGYLDKICARIEEDLKEVGVEFEGEDWARVVKDWIQPRREKHIGVAAFNTDEDGDKDGGKSESVLPESFKLDDSKICAILMQKEEEFSGKIPSFVGDDTGFGFIEESNENLCEKVFKKIQENSHDLESEEEQPNSGKVFRGFVSPISFEKKMEFHEEKIED